MQKSLVAILKILGDLVLTICAGLIRPISKMYVWNSLLFYDVSHWFVNYEGVWFTKQNLVLVFEDVLT
jgi:hypothetical protein